MGRVTCHAKQWPTPQVDGVTRKARFKSTDPVRELKGPILAPGCSRVCPICADKHYDPWRCHGTLLRHPSFEFIVFNPSFEFIMFNLIFHALTVAPSSEPKGPCPRKLGKGPFWH
jgi:hypothetical protein